MVDWCVRADQEEQGDNHRTNGGRDITRHISYNVLHLQRRILAVLPAVKV